MLHTLFFPALLEREVSKALTLQGQAFLLATATCALLQLHSTLTALLRLCSASYTNELLSFQQLQAQRTLCYLGAVKPTSKSSQALMRVKWQQQQAAMLLCLAVFVLRHEQLEGLLCFGRESIFLMAPGSHPQLGKHGRVLQKSAGFMGCKTALAQHGALHTSLGASPLC